MHRAVHRGHTDELVMVSIEPTYEGCNFCSGGKAIIYLLLVANPHCIGRMDGARGVLGHGCGIYTSM